MYPVDLLSHNWLIKKALNAKIGPALAGKHGLVIDLGCGSRPFEAEISRVSEEYVGLDWQNSLHHAPADILCDLNLPLPIRDSAADFVVSFEVLEHLFDPATALGESFRILRSGGRILITTPFQWWMHEAPWDYFRYTKYGLRHLLERAGFIEIQIEPTTGFWSMWFLKLNYQTRRMIRGPRLLRLSLLAALAPIWYMDQAFAAAMDRIWPDESETAGYIAMARKP